jgi:peptidoglycan/xylan/chitin deacetylase (PgdA/CDA1 family)
MPALMYHDVVPEGAEDASGFPGRDAALYKVTPAAFAAHLAAIRRAVPDASAVQLTFDDGGESAMEAADVLEQHGFTGRFFMTANYIGAPGFLTASQLRELRRRGHLIGTHSCSHPLRIGHCQPQRLRREWTDSRRIIADALGEEITLGSVPGGDFAPAVAAAAAEAGLRLLYTSEPTARDWQAGPLTLRGRYTIQRWTRPHTAAALASGHLLPRLRQAALWNIKKLGKRLAGEHYLRVRRRLLGQDTVYGGERETAEELRIRN